MKKLVIFSVVCMLVVLFGIIISLVGALNTSTLIVEENVSSEILEDEREVIIYQPPGYSMRFTRHYPVLYLLDGQEYFGEPRAATDQAWTIQRTLDRLMRNDDVEDIIVVGISSGDERLGGRTSDDDQNGQTGKLADQYVHYIIEELKPYIDRKYRTLAEPEHTAIAGSTFAGLLSIYAGWNQADVFSKVGALTPLLWREGQDITPWLDSSPEAGDLRIWMDSVPFDADESGLFDQDILDNNDQLLDMNEWEEALLNQGYTPGQDMIIQTRDLDPDMEQDLAAERSLEQRVEEMVRFLFPPPINERHRG